MIASECLLAAVLLTTSPDLPQPREALVWADVCRHSLVALALDGQLVDTREPAIHFNRPHDRGSDLKALQSRFQEFAFAPVLEECQRFPNRRIVNDFLAFNRAYRAELQARLDLDAVQAVHLRQALKETEQLHHLWCEVRDAGCEYYYITVRRQALQHLRDLLGDEAFYSGRLPPYVPVWRFPVER